MAVETASPGKLILMLYNGAIGFLDRAEDGFSMDGSLAEKYERVSNNLIKAQKIIAELQSALDFNRSKEIAENLFRLYGFMSDQLQEANLKKTPEPIRTVRRLLVELRDSWEEMLSNQEGVVRETSGAPCLFTSA